MDPKLVWKSLEGYHNELDPERKALEAFYRNFNCKRCGSQTQKEISPKHAFNDPDTMNPRSLLRCTNCRCLFDPHSGLVVELGDQTKTLSGIPLINKNEK